MCVFHSLPQHVITDIPTCPNRETAACRLHLWLIRPHGCHGCEARPDGTWPGRARQ